MPEYFVLALIAATSLVGVAAGLLAFGLPLRDLPPAVGKTLEAIGLAIVFSVLNVFAGAVLLLLGRLVTGRFLSLYYANDIALVVCSVLQALVFQRWREAKASASPGTPRKRWFKKHEPPRSATRTPREGDLQIRELLRTAILQKEHVFAFRKGRLITFCPHALASGPNGLYVLAFLIAGDVDIRDDTFSSPKRWRWIPTAELQTVMRRPGEWFSAPRESRPLVRSLSIEVEA